MVRTNSNKNLQMDLQYDLCIPEAKSMVSPLILAGQRVFWKEVGDDSYGLEW